MVQMNLEYLGNLYIEIKHPAENTTRRVSEMQNFEILPLSHRRRM